MFAPPPPPGGPGPGAPAARSPLDRQIGEVCVAGQPGVLPLASYSPARGHLVPPIPSGRDLLTTVAGPPPVNQQMCERLLSALASVGNGNAVAFAAVRNTMTIRAFRTAIPAAQIAFIDQLWNALATSHVFATLPGNMFDPAGDIPANGEAPLPSSWCPTGPGALTFHKRLRGKQPWRELGVGFRVDGRDQASINRVLGGGMTQQRLNPGFMLGPSRGLRLDGTTMNNPIFARVWTGNHDIFNESAVCVSRNFMGGTAFPERETVGFVYLWAVDCSTLPGFDTEQHQLNLPGSRQWRPGEKAFQAIPANCVLGYVAINRRGAPATGGWRVEIPADARWTYTGTPSVRQRVYMEDELAAWRGDHIIPSNYDFAT